MPRSIFKQLALSLLLSAGLSAASYAKSGAAQIPQLPEYQQECAACHIAYPPGMLPKASWQRLMSTLNKHYGADASLDETMAREITRWLKAHAGTYKRVRDEPPQDRITRSTWFLQKHRAAEVPSEVWSRAAVGSASNCSACHGNAAQGSFSERDIKIPK